MSLEQSRLLFRCLEMVSALVIVFLLGLALWLAGPIVEARFFPVATKLSVEQMESTPTGTRIQAARFIKLRSCEFKGISWFALDDKGAYYRVAVIPETLSAEGILFGNRPLGENVIGPWLISLPLRDVIYRSLARVHHRCHPFWLTITDFYP